MLRRLLLGLIKGLIIGGAVGALLHFGLGATAITLWVNYLLYGAVVGLAGALAGQPPWRKDAWIASILKFIFGLGLGAGMYALASRFLHVPVEGLAGIPAGTELAHAPLLFAPLAASVYAMLVELDDGGESAAAATDKTSVRVQAGGSDELDDEVPVERSERAARKGKG